MTLAQIFQTARDWILPPHCLICDTTILTNGCLCAPCWKSIRFIDKPRCPITGVPFAHPWPAHMQSAQSRLVKPPYDYARAAMLYGSEKSRILIAQMKFRDHPEIAIPAAQWIARASRDILNKADLLAPVPLHRRRLFQRRFNQSAEIARALSQISQIPHLPDLLIRARHTQQQTGLKRRDRERNVARAFIINPHHKKRVKGRSVLIIDDVMTSGATSGECAQTLRRAGAGAIGVLTVARVVHPHETHP